MAQQLADNSNCIGNQDAHFNPTSPHSSSGAADSFKGTPDTRLTSFSPEDNNCRSGKAPPSLSVITQAGTPVKFPMKPSGSDRCGRESDSTTSSIDYNLKDPFVTSTAAKLGQKLSPTALSFFPTHVNSSHDDISRDKATTSLPGLMQRMPSETLSYFKNTGTNKRVRLQGTTHNALIHPHLSTETGLSRFMIISKPGAPLRSVEVESYFLELAEAGYPCHGMRQIHEYAEKVVVRFASIRAAASAASNVSRKGKDWVVHAISPQEFCLLVEPSAELVSSHEGQLYLSIFPHPANRLFEERQLLETIITLLQAEGDVFAFKKESGVQGSLLSAIVEYCTNEASMRAVSKLNGAVLAGFHICMTPYKPDILTPLIQNFRGAGGISPSSTSITQLGEAFQRLCGTGPHSTTSNVPGIFNTPARSQLAAGFSVRPAYNMMPMVYHSIPATPPYVADNVPHRVAETHLTSQPNYSIPNVLSASSNPIGSPDTTIPCSYSPFGRRQHATRVTRSPHHNAAGAHNVVDVNRIREGTDVRTTIMLRNIPNKVDQAMLKRIVDESSWGKYDFMYLRIDFANDCNVGYAFINFVDPLDIIDFVKARGNQRWNCFKSDKVAEISYATIQGKDCLVQKFRNSSVMLEAEHYRPKLYYTLNGPRPDLAGEEEPFPGPDNPSKMKRSCENAEHVGLFTPNAGQHFRDEQRRRRSQFDRGTRFAAYEEYDHDNVLQQAFYGSQ